MAVTAPASPPTAQILSEIGPEKPTPGEARRLAKEFAAAMDDGLPSADQKARVAALKALEVESTPGTRSRVRHRFQSTVHDELGTGKRARRKKLHLVEADRAELPLPMYAPAEHVANRHLSAPGESPVTSAQGVVMSWKDNKPTTTFSGGMSAAEFEEMLAKSTPVATAGDRSERKSPDGVAIVCLTDDTPATAHTAYPVFFQADYERGTSYTILKDGSLKLTAGKVRQMAIRAIKKYNPIEDMAKKKNPIASLSDTHVTVDIAAQIKRSQFAYNTGVRFVFPVAELNHIDDFALKATWR
ncbi:MAG: hypothetical protein SP1CHLAM54_05650 [Chlamydiia bacterium]|nr:hypothetical protein [Chlamydiia bacterium]MCH9615475.1 hypothetical protein [Chlamydiia bacterium]MCH9629130.1 hypothetical protein [Chlamydiia bacterium]